MSYITNLQYFSNSELHIPLITKFTSIKWRKSLDSYVTLASQLEYGVYVWKI